jgi:hypothetical protein
MALSIRPMQWANLPEHSRRREGIVQNLYYRWLKVKIRSPANGFKFSGRSSHVSCSSGGKAATSAWWLNERTCRRKNGIRSETVL